MTNVEESFVKLQKSELKKIEVSELPKKIPDFKNSDMPKDNLIYNWLKSWITEGLRAKTIQPNSLLPKKSDLAYYLGVSIGTVQNAIRFVEDDGHLESKQRIGTMIKDSVDAPLMMRKLTSKRERAISAIKKFIIDSEIKIGEEIPSAKKLSNIINSSNNTTRLAVEFLISKGIIEEVKNQKYNEVKYLLKENIIKENVEEITEISADTLVKKVENDIKDIINKQFKLGDKMWSNYELADTLKVSIKTVHDAMKNLTEEGILLPRRGRYGTTIVKMPNDVLKPVKEMGIFASAQEAAFYRYQKIETHIKSIIKEKYEVGDKLPSMEQLSADLEVSSNTIKKALQSLADKGYLEFVRGRYGGTFIVDIPEETQQSSFKWLAVNPKYVEVYKN